MPKCPYTGKNMSARDLKKCAFQKKKSPGPRRKQQDVEPWLKRPLNEDMPKVEPWRRSGLKGPSNEDMRKLYEENKEAIDARRRAKSQQNQQDGSMYRTYIK